MALEIIAEVGVNHNGDVKTACDLAIVAKEAGCDTVKFQLFDLRRSYGDDPPDDVASLTVDELRRVKQHCAMIDIGFLCTPDDATDADDLAAMGVKRFKIGSSNITNLPLIDKIARYGAPLLLSTGASSWDDVRKAMQTIHKAGARHRTTIMHCVSGYPTPLAQMNLKLIRVLRQHYRCSVGLSDHTSGVEAALMAMAQDACVVEKHITCSHDCAGPDHAMSLTPSELFTFVHTLREAEKAMGDGFKTVQPCEWNNRQTYRNFVARQLGETV